jgi:hypothetical protein
VCWWHGNATARSMREQGCGDSGNARFSSLTGHLRSGLVAADLFGYPQLCARTGSAALAFTRDGPTLDALVKKLRFQGYAVSFQITVLKVLAGHPNGRAALGDLTRYVSVLISSGTDWTDQTKRLAARAPKLDIFADSLVLRDDMGWQITETGRHFLASLEAPLPIMSEAAVASEATGDKEHRSRPNLRLVVNNEKPPPDQGASPSLRSA